MTLDTRIVWVENILEFKVGISTDMLALSVKNLRSLVFSSTHRAQNSQDLIVNRGCSVRGA